MRFLVFLVLTAGVVACNDDDAAFVGPTYTMDAGLRAWLTTYPESGEVFSYRNADGETATVRVEARTFPADDQLSVCQRRGEEARCTYENVLLRFDGNNPEPMYLAVWLFAEDRITLVATDQVDNLVPEIARYAENIALFSDLDAAHFSTLFISGYLNPDNTVTSAFRVVNTDSTGLDALPPFGVTLVKERGVVEWTDRAGAVWRAE